MDIVAYYVAGHTKKSIILTTDHQQAEMKLKTYAAYAGIVTGLKSTKAAARKNIKSCYSRFYQRGTVMSTKFSGFDNRECPVCGKIPHHVVVCHMHQANICMSHCYENGRCSHQEVIGGQAHCTYKLTAEQAMEKIHRIMAKTKGLPP